MATIAEYRAVAAETSMNDTPPQVHAWLAGDDRMFSVIPNQAHPWSMWGSRLMELMPDPAHLEDADVRALRAVVAGHLWIPIGDWLRRHLAMEPPEADWTGLVLHMAEEAQVPAHLPMPDKPDAKPWDMKPPLDGLTLVTKWFSRYRSSGMPNSAGRRLLDMPESELGMRCWFASKLQDYREDEARSFFHLVQFLVAYRRTHILPHLDRILDPYFESEWLPLIAPLASLEGSDQELSDQAISRLVHHGHIEILSPFYRRNPPRFRAACVAALVGPLQRPNPIFDWAKRMVVADFVGSVPVEVLAELRPYSVLWWCPDVLQAAVEHGKEAAIPLLADRLDYYLAATDPLRIADPELPDPSRYIGGRYLELDAVLRLCCTVDWPVLRDRLVTCLRRALGQTVSGETVSYAGTWGHQTVQAFSPALALALKDELVHLIDHPEPALRAAALRAYALVGDEAQRHACLLLRATKAARRLAGATILAAQHGQEIIRLLHEHLNSETDLDVRDACHQGLCRQPDRPIPSAETLARWRALQMRKVVKLPLWLKPEGLPSLVFLSGETLDVGWIAFMVRRQQRVEDVSIDPEVEFILRLLRPDGQADFAATLTTAFLGSKVEAKDRFVLALAGRLGDDRIVEALAPLIPVWAEKGRGQLACLATDAIASLTSDRAIRALEHIAELFRTRMRNVGRQAEDGLRHLAAQRGMTVEELGDATVPDCGFGADGRQSVGNSVVLLRGDGRVVTDCNPSGKKIAKDIARAHKQLQADVNHAMKIQARRHERMLVNQRRWPVSTWLQQYRHPLLRVFAHGCCWGSFDADGRLLTTFRQMTDGTMCDAYDNAVTIPSHVMAIGLIHPLDLDGSALTAWRQHLCDHETMEPFPQLSRTIHRLSSDQASHVRHHGTKGAMPFSLTFRGRADRRGWVRGSICDGGGITTYYRRFTIPQIDVFISIVEGVHIGNTRDDKAILGSSWFVRSGTVRLGSYVYDEPRNDDDPRLLPFGSLPALVWSEAMDDCLYLSGRASPQDDEGEGVNLRERIISNVQLMGDDGLVAMSNRGLVRRARKDLEAAKPESLDETPVGLSLRWDLQTVVLAERPAESRCTCPAGGICRHILACLLHLGSTPATEPSGTSAFKPCGAEITSLQDEEVERWAGKAVWKRARRELAFGLSVTCEDGALFIGRIAEWNAECRWMPGGGLAGMLCSCHEPGVCVHRVAVVLAWQVQQGRLTIERDDAVPEASAGAVRTRPEVCEEVAALCEDLVSLGFSRTGPTHAERFRTMAMAAHGVDLPRLERLVRGLAQEIDGWLSRDPQASDNRLLERTAACWALSKALTKLTPELVGVHRSQYERVHNLDLVGAGLEVWKTSSGYQGLSVYFWDQHSRRWCTWSEARPVTTTGFDPVGRAAAPGPWPGATSPSHISTASGVLMGAWRNRALRLSGRPASRWHSKRATTMADLPSPVEDWRDFWIRLPDMCPIGFADRKFNSDIVLVRPTKWLPSHFDTHRQVLVRGLVDTGGRQIPIMIPQSAHTKAAISQVESLPDAADRSLLARLQISADGISLHPISLVDSKGIRSVTHADKPTPAILSAPAQEDDGPDEDTDDETMPLGSSPVLDRCLDACLALGNAGMRSFRQWPLVTAAASEARGLGLGSLSAALDRLVEAQGRGRAEVLLLSTWILTCQRQAMQVAACQHEVEHG